MSLQLNEIPLPVKDYPGTSGACAPGAFFSTAALATVSSRKFNSQQITSRVSNPRTTAHAHFKMPFERSNLPWAGWGPLFRIRTFENWPCALPRQRGARRLPDGVGAHEVP